MAYGLLGFLSVLSGLMRDRGLGKQSSHCGWKR